MEDNEKGAEGEVVVDLVGSKEVDEVDVAVVREGDEVERRRRGRKMSMRSRKEVDVDEEVFDEVAKKISKRPRS